MTLNLTFGVHINLYEASHSCTILQVKKIIKGTGVSNFELSLKVMKC